MAYDIGPLDGGGDQGVQRMLALANYLETVSDCDYDHCAWRRERSEGSFAMCALGHGVSALPAAIGLRWRKPGGADIVRLDGSGFTQSTLALAGEAFELTLEEAETIFGIGPHTVAFYGARGVSGIKPRLVAAAIRRFAFDRMAGSFRANVKVSFSEGVLSGP
ncbi:hypothetical protein LJR219_004678 [Phenylobacterium sp. LjRoot219]|uniref:hypothetical protein n=1 Tax=Phenylobacterium sp. LjRoot219 TaxID=3342283 RepID=UPI003ED00364